MNKLENVVESVLKNFECAEKWQNTALSQIPPDLPEEQKNWISKPIMKAIEASSQAWMIFNQRGEQPPQQNMKTTIDHDAAQDGMDEILKSLDQAQKLLDDAQGLLSNFTIGTPSDLLNELDQSKKLIRTAANANRQAYNGIKSHVNLGIIRSHGATTERPQRETIPSRIHNPSPQANAASATELRPKPIAHQKTSHPPYQKITEDLCHDYNAAIEDPQRRSGFMKQYDPIRVGVINAIARRQDPSIESVFQTANDGDYYAIQIGNKNFYLVVPRFNLTLEKFSYGPGAIEKVFDCPNYDPKLYYRSVNVMRPAIFEAHADRWALITEGELDLSGGK